MADQIISILNDLVETSKDGEEGFRAAAEDTVNAELQALFLDNARRTVGVASSTCSN